MAKRPKMHWTLDFSKDAAYVICSLNDDINSLIPKINHRALEQKYLEILSTSSGNNFNCIIIR